jgi:outer membrane protein OmpA-like peptidoglycan-associated protein
MLGAQVGCATTKEAPIERTTVEPATSAVGAPPSAPAVTPSEPPGSAAPTDPSQGRDFAPMYGAPWSGFIPSNVCFEGPTAKIKADASGTLETMADAIKSSAVPVEVHARATAAEAKDPHTLAERRLKAAVAALVKLGAPVKRIVPMNLGAAPPSPEVDPTAPPCIDFKFQFKEHSED